jgi:hypothetical protein
MRSPPADLVVVDEAHHVRLRSMPRSLPRTRGPRSSA